MTRSPRIAGRLLPATLLSLALGVAALPAAAAEWFDTVIANGRVIDPESGLDAVRNVGIRGGVIRAVTTDKLEGHDVIDASGLVVGALGSAIVLLSDGRRTSGPDPLQVAKLAADRGVGEHARLLEAAGRGAAGSRRPVRLRLRGRDRHRACRRAGALSLIHI